MLSSTPPFPTRTSIWQQKRQQLIARLAAKGIHISEDDPRLAEPPTSDFDSTSSADRDRSVESSGSLKFDSGNEWPRQDSPPPTKSKPEKRIDFGSPENAAQDGESLLFGQDPVSEARRRRELQEATRQQLQQQIMEKQMRLRSSADRDRSMDSPPPTKSKPERRIDFGSLENAAQDGESLLFGQDPASESRRRRELQEATRQQLQQQIMEKQRRLEVERIERRMQLLSQASDKQPLPPGNGSDSKPPTPSPSPNVLPSVIMIGSDPAVEQQRRRQMQSEMNKILQQQIREKAIMERMAQTSAASDFSTTTRAPYVNNFTTASPHRLRSPEPGCSARPPVSIAALDRDPEQEVFRRKKSQADLNSFLRLQMQERQQNRKSSERAVSSQEANGSPFLSGHDRRHRLRESPNLYSNDERSEFSGRTPQVSRGIGSLPFADRADSPGTARRKKREYAEALQNQMMRSPAAPGVLDAAANRAGGQLSESPFQNAFLLGEKAQTPEISRQRQRDYAEALQLQMLERRQRQLREKALQDEADGRFDPNESNQSQTRAVFSDPPVEANRGCSPTRAVEKHFSPPSAFSSPGAASTPSIFDHDPVKVAISQKLQRKQLGEELQKQMDEQRKRKEEFKLKEQQENHEYHNRILKQIEEMNRACTKQDPSQSQQTRKQEEPGETGFKSRQEETGSKLHREEPVVNPGQEQGIQSPRLRNPRPPQMQDAVEPDQYSPVKNGTTFGSLDWNQTEDQIIRPLRELRNKLSMGSEELRQRIAQQRQKIQDSNVKPESDFEDLASSLPYTTSWLPVEPESEGQLPVQSEFVEVPATFPHRCQIASDEDTLERFVNESEVPPPRACGSATKRRFLWGPPTFPSAMASSDVCDSPKSNQNDIYWSGRPHSNITNNMD